MYLVNESGSTVAEYEYDPYGKILSATGEIAEINPLRYRSYYYDSETGFYYLQSRYYDPNTCRFINADSYASTGQGFLGYNMFAYCGNNPISRVDESGDFWVTLGIMAVGGVIGAITSAVSSVIMQDVTEGSVNVGSVIVAAATGFVSGAVSASPLGRTGQAVLGGAINFISYSIECSVNGSEYDPYEALLTTVIGAGSGWLGGNGMNHQQKLTNVFRYKQSTITKEIGRSNRKYALKASRNAKDYFNNRFGYEYTVLAINATTQTMVSDTISVGYSYGSKYVKNHIMEIY